MGSCKTFGRNEKSSFRATPAKAGGDPESGDFEAILDSGFRRNDGTSESCKKLRRKI
jgi:hypothetical protein